MAAARSLQETLQEACVSPFELQQFCLDYELQEHVVSDKSSFVAELPAVDVGTVDAGDVSADTELDTEICSICLRPNR